MYRSRTALDPTFWLPGHCVPPTHIVGITHIRITSCLLGVSGDAQRMIDGALRNQQRAAHGYVHPHSIPSWYNSPFPSDVRRTQMRIQGRWPEGDSVLYLGFILSLEQTERTSTSCWFVLL